MNLVLTHQRHLKTEQSKLKQQRLRYFQFLVWVNLPKIPAPTFPITQLEGPFIRAFLPPKCPLISYFLFRRLPSPENVSSSIKCNPCKNIFLNLQQILCNWCYRTGSCRKITDDLISISCKMEVFVTFRLPREQQETGYI